MKWSDGKAGRRQSKFGDLLKSVERNQDSNPGRWAEIARYTSRQVASDTANRLRDKYKDEFEIKSQTDPETREGVVLARARRDTTDTGS